MNYDDVIKAVEGRNWYALAAFAVLALIMGWKRFSPDLYYRIPEGYRWIPPLMLAALTGFADAYQSQLPWQQALLRAGYAILVIGLGASGAHGWLKESPIPYSGGQGGRKTKSGSVETSAEPARLEIQATKFLALSLLLLIPSCATVKPIARTAHDIAVLWCEAHYRSSGKDSVSAQELCASEKVLRPWIDMILAGEKNGIKSGAPVCEPGEEKR